MSQSVALSVQRPPPGQAVGVSTVHASPRAAPERTQTPFRYGPSTRNLAVPGAHASLVPPSPLCPTPGKPTAATGNEVRLRARQKGNRVTRLRPDLHLVLEHRDFLLICRPKLAPGG